MTGYNFAEKINKFRIEYQDTILNYAFILLAEKGYSVDKLCVINPSNLYGDYIECPAEFITFKGFECLPSVSSGFDFTHIQDKNCSILLHRYDDELSYDELLDVREELLESLIFWAKELPVKQLHSK